MEHEEAFRYRSLIENRPISQETLIENFRYFTEVVEAIQPQLDAILSHTEFFLSTIGSDNDPLAFLAARLELPEDCELLGVGTMSIVIKYQEFVLRFPRAEAVEARQEHAIHRVAAIPWGEHIIEGVEELVSVSLEHGVAVSRYIEGSPLSHASSDEVLAIAKADIKTAEAAIDQLHEQGLCLDNPDNIILSATAPEGKRLFIIDPIINDSNTRTAERDKQLLREALAQATPDIAY